MDLGDRPPWSNNQLKRLGKAIREGREQEWTQLPYSELVVWYDELQATVQDMVRRLDLTELLPGMPLKITGRPKTIDTVRQKLLANPSWSLPSVFDIAGVRVEGDMNLLTQDEVARRIAARLGCVLDDVVSDTRAAPHSGYRAIHLRVSAPAGRFEVQVRTLVQGEWANVYEWLGDQYGRSIRYGVWPTDRDACLVVFATQVLSIHLAKHELVRAGLEATEEQWEVSEARLRDDYERVRQWSVQLESDLEDQLEREGSPYSAAWRAWAKAAYGTSDLFSGDYDPRAWLSDEDTVRENVRRYFDGAATMLADLSVLREKLQSVAMGRRS